jgi:hypothetical protein
MAHREPGNDPPQWIGEILNSAPDPSEPAPPTSATGDPVWTPATSSNVDANKLPAEIRALMELGDKPAKDVRGKAYLLTERREFDQAYLEVDRFVTANPHTWTMMWHSQVMAALLSGRFQEAERLCIVRMQSKVSWDPILAPYGLSLALASQGRVLPGQATYVRYGLARVLSQTSDWEPGVSDHPKVVATNSALMLGLKCLHQTAFLEWVLRLDPICTVAARTLREEYDAEVRTDEAVRVAKSLVKNLPPGEVRDDFQRRLKRLESQAPSSPKGEEGVDRIERK